MNYGGSRRQVVTSNNKKAVVAVKTEHIVAQQGQDLGCSRSICSAKNSGFEVSMANSLSVNSVP